MTNSMSLVLPDSPHSRSIECFGPRRQGEPLPRKGEE